MANAPLIVKYKLEERVQKLLAKGRTHAQACAELNEYLAERHAGNGPPPKVSQRTFDRYVRALRKETAVELHRPQQAARNVEAGINLAGRITRRMETIDARMEELESLKEVDDHGKPIANSRDWEQYRKWLGEERQWLAMYADLLERIHNAQAIERFQALVMETISEVEPEVAQRIEARMRESSEIRRAALLGLAA